MKKKQKKIKTITKEREKGRSEDYSQADQWAEDRQLGILDWDGN
jgi:hypothetical protein